MNATRAHRKRESRRRLLEAAARHFAERGFEAASVDRIALDAGLAKGSVYNHFDSKEALFGAVLAEACRRAVLLADAAAGAGGWRDRLRALARADVEVFREQRDFYRVLFREVLAARPATWPVVMEHLRPFLERVEEILEAGRRAGAVRRDLAVHRLALYFAGMLALLYVQHEGSAGAWPALEEIPDLALSLFLDGAAGRPEAADLRGPPSPDALAGAGPRGGSGAAGRPR